MAAADVKPVDPKTMVEVEGGNKAVEPVFEGVEIGRGQGKPKGYEGQHIITRHIQVWHVSESQFVELPPECHGQFHSSKFLLLISYDICLFVSRGKVISVFFFICVRWSHNREMFDES